MMPETRLSTGWKGISRPAVLANLYFRGGPFSSPGVRFKRAVLYSKTGGGAAMLPKLLA